MLLEIRFVWNNGGQKQFKIYDVVVKCNSTQLCMEIVFIHSATT